MTYVVSHSCSKTVTIQLHRAVEVVPSLEIGSVAVQEVPPRPVSVSTTLLNVFPSEPRKCSRLDSITPDLVDSIANLEKGFVGPVSLSREGLHLREQLHEGVQKQVGVAASILTKVNDEFLLLIAHALLEKLGDSGLEVVVKGSLFHVRTGVAE